MQSEILQKAGITHIAVSGFPEGNPNIPGNDLMETLEAKIEFGRSGGLALRIVTQFCFESEPIVEWLQCIRARGIDVPVRVGFAGPAGLLALTRYAIRCGVGNSIRVLTEKPAFARLLVDKGPEPIIRGVYSRLNGQLANSSGSIAPHFFAFGGFNKTINWIEECTAAIAKP